LQTTAVEEVKIHIFVQILFSENRAVYEIIRKNAVEQGGQQITMWRMRIACWIPKDTDTYPEYEILIDFPVQQ
jgi:hypothetical protein